jgi:hypothetical protein
MALSSGEAGICRLGAARRGTRCQDALALPSATARGRAPLSRSDELLCAKGRPAMSGQIADAAVIEARRRD